MLKDVPLTVVLEESIEVQLITTFPDVNNPALT
jgi:hypothetical protein